MVTKESELGGIQPWSSKVAVPKKRRGPSTRPHRSRSHVAPTIYTSDDEPLVPVLADSMSTVPASSKATSVAAQPTKVAETFDLTIDSDLSESPAVQASRGRRRVVREDSSEDNAGPNLLRRGRFAVLADNDTESVDVHSHVQEEAHKMSQQDGEDVCAFCGRSPPWWSMFHARPPRLSQTARSVWHGSVPCESDSRRSGVSEADADLESELEALVDFVNVNLRARAVTSGFESLETINQTDVSQFKASIMQSVPKFLSHALVSTLSGRFNPSEKDRRTSGTVSEWTLCSLR